MSCPPGTMHMVPGQGRHFCSLCFGVELPPSCQAISTQCCCPSPHNPQCPQSGLPCVFQSHQVLCRSWPSALAPGHTWAPPRLWSSSEPSSTALSQPVQFCLFQSGFSTCCEALPHHQDQPGLWVLPLPHSSLPTLGNGVVPGTELMGPSFCPACPQQGPLTVTGTAEPQQSPDWMLRCPSGPRLCSLHINFPLSSQVFPWPAALLPLLGFSSRGGCSLSKAVLLP